MKIYNTVTEIRRRTDGSSIFSGPMEIFEVKIEFISAGDTRSIDIDTILKAIMQQCQTVDLTKDSK